MKSALCLGILSLLVFSTSAFAAAPKAGENSANICNETATICAQLQYLTDINASNEGKFQVVVTTPQQESVQNFKLDLWMQMGHHGHGSSPVEIAEVGPNQFTISNAWFVMPGQWNVRVDFDFQGEHQHLEIPVIAAP
ncbi:MAG: FixH family protein [Bacillota bacterium]